MHTQNNFHFLRFIFALLVVISHSYALSGGDISTQWIYEVTDGKVVYASIGLNGFFVISGYFIYQSLQRSKSLLEYYWKRILRVFPALFVVLTLSVILSPFVYNSEIPFYRNIEVYTYVPRNLLLYPDQPKIEGIFADNPYKAINGSLWTIRYEFTCYIILSVLFLIKSNKLWSKLLLFCASSSMYIGYVFFVNELGNLSMFNLIGFEVLQLGTFFVVGSFLASLNIEKLFSKWMVFMTLGILMLSVIFDFYNEVKHLIFSLFVLSLGFTTINFMAKFAKYGDMSYGVYIYSFPIQQTLVYFFDLGTYALMFNSVIFSIVMGYLSWHTIEKQALKRKKKISILQIRNN